MFYSKVTFHFIFRMLIFNSMRVSTRQYFCMSMIIKEVDLIAGIFPLFFKLCLNSQKRARKEKSSSQLHRRLAN